MKPDSLPRLLILLPSLRISGGVREVLRLGAALRARGVEVTLLVLWKHAHEASAEGLDVAYLSRFGASKKLAALQAVLLLARFPRFVRRWAGLPAGTRSIMATHFSTLPFLLLAPRRVRRWCFQQDLEWLFVPAGALRILLRRFILRVARRSRLVTSNAWVSEQYRSFGLRPVAQASTWAEPFWLTSENPDERAVDAVMLLRLGRVKRLDLYVALLRHLRAHTHLRCAVATSEDEAYRQTKDLAHTALLRPTNEELRALYGNAKIFVLLSEAEGFALPPLEAMGSGCVPLCRDSGGPRGYLDGILAGQLIPLDAPVAAVARRIERLAAGWTGVAALSEPARLQFQQGFVQSEREREECFTLLAREMAVPETDKDTP